MGEWKECKLGAVITSNVQSINKDYPHNTIQYLDTGSITCGKVDSFQELLLEDAPSRAKRLVKHNDIVYSTVRPIQRHYGFITNPSSNLVVSTGFSVIETKTNLAEPLFIYYYLTSPDIVEILDVIADGSTSAYPSLKPSDIENLDISLPPLPEQKAIASVLSSLDDKIDLLHRQNKTLEAMAETLFRQWFVEEAQEDWEKVTLEVLVETANTGLDAIRRAPIVEEETGVKCLRIQDISQKKNFSNWGNSIVNEKDFEKARLKEGDIIMARTCSPGIIYFAREDLKAVFNNGLAKIRPNKKKTYSIFLYYLFRTKDFIGHIYGISDGTSVQLNMKLGDLLSYRVIFPPKQIQNDYYPTFKTIDNKIFYDKSQIHTLEKLRDTLLPKLMGGEVRVQYDKKVSL